MVSCYWRARVDTSTYPREQHPGSTPGKIERWPARTEMSYLHGTSLRQSRFSVRCVSAPSRRIRKASIISFPRARVERKPSTCTDLPRPGTFGFYRRATRQEVFHDRNHPGRPCGADIRHLGEKQASGLFGFCKGITTVIPSRSLAATGESSGWKRRLPLRERVTSGH
jgi:hypothetical protein